MPIFIINPCDLTMYNNYKDQEESKNNYVNSGGITKI